MSVTVGTICGLVLCLSKLTFKSCHSKSLRVASIDYKMWNESETIDTVLRNKYQFFAKDIQSRMLLYNMVMSVDRFASGKCVNIRTVRLLSRKHLAIDEN